MLSILNINGGVMSTKELNLLTNNNKCICNSMKKRKSLLNWVATIFYYGKDYTELLLYLDQHKVSPEMVSLLYLRVVSLHESDYIEIFGPVQYNLGLNFRQRYMRFKEFPIDYRKLKGVI